MDLFFDILKIVLPSTLVFLTAFYSIKKFLENEEKKQLIQMRKEGQKLITPIRLQAYERITMYLERIAPNTLVNRVYKNGMTSRMLQIELLNTIRNEFNHNLSQQVYLSDTAWSLTKNGKEEMIKLINLASTKVKDDASGVDLSKVILQVSMKINKLPTDIAIQYLKKEIRQLF
jgi:hypothetical protein